MESSRKPVRFGAFEVDLANAELRKSGLRLRLQDQPFVVLAALLEHPGEVVTREELIRRLWTDGTVVDFDRGLNAAITRLRQVLSDSAEVPKYVETVARRGYRFIAPVEDRAAAARPAPPSRSKRPGWVGPAVTLVLISLSTVAAWWALSRRPASMSENPPRIVPLTTEPGFEWSPSFSPDGNQVAFEWDKGDGEPHIYIKLVGLGDPIPLTSGPGAEYGPAWSRDGRFIAFLRKLDESRTGVFLVPALGGVQRKLTEFCSPGYWVLKRQYRRLDWTRDGRHLIVSGPQQVRGADGLFLVSSDSGEKTWLTKPAADLDRGDREPAISPDGFTVAFVRFTALTAGDVYILPLDRDQRPVREPRRLTSFNTISKNPAWTPDGREILFSSNYGGVVRLWRTGWKGKAPPRSLTSLGTGVFFPALAQRNRLTYARFSQDTNIWRQELLSHSETIPPAVSLIASTAVDQNAQYSPDGTRIAFESWRSGSPEIWVCASNGTRCVQLTAFNGPYVGTPRWSPDGKRIAFDCTQAGNFDVYVVDANGGSPQRLTADPLPDAIPSWSKDGKWIYFMSSRTGRHEIWRLPSAGGAAKQVTRNGGQTAFESPDGTVLYYTRSDSDTKLFKSALDGSGEREVLDGVAQRGFVVTADQIYYLRSEQSGGETLRFFMLATGKDFLISSISKSVSLGLSLSPDQKYLIYSQVDQQGSDLMLVDEFH